MKVHLPVRKAILNRRTYEAPAEGRSDKLRLDFNENTSGCSPAVRRPGISGASTANRPPLRCSPGRIIAYQWW
jgi:hypothetical protein